MRILNGSAALSAENHIHSFGREFPSEGLIPSIAQRADNGVRAWQRTKARRSSHRPFRPAQGEGPALVAGSRLEIAERPDRNPISG